MQVHGGMGYIEETGAAQFMRDARIAGIYEGTNGIQAIDLVTRKIPLAGGAAVGREIAFIRAVAADGGRQGRVRRDGEAARRGGRRAGAGDRLYARHAR